MSLPTFSFDGAHAVLTGAASGMGEQMAHQLAARGTHLVLVDRDVARLTDVAAQLATTHPALSIHTEVADLAEASAIDDLVRRILEVSPRVELLINNAGVALGGDFLDLTKEEFDWVMSINFQAPVDLTRGLLPALVESNGGHVVNVSSLFGLIGPAGQSAYSSSKFAIRGFSEVLRHELAPLGVGVTTVHPGGIKTRIAETARVAASATAEQEAAGKKTFEKLLTFPADKAAHQILRGVERRKPRVLIAISAVVPDLFARLSPAHYGALLNLVMPAKKSRRQTAPTDQSDDVVRAAS